MLQRLRRTTKALFYGRNGISPNIDKFLNNHGDEFVLEIYFEKRIFIHFDWIVENTIQTI